MFDRGQGGERLSVAVSQHGRSVVEAPRSPAGVVDRVLEGLPGAVPVQARVPLLVRDDPVRSDVGGSGAQPERLGAHLTTGVLEVPGRHVQLVHVRKLMVGPTPVVSVGLRVVMVGRMRMVRMVWRMRRVSPGYHVPRPLVH